MVQIDRLAFVFICIFAGIGAFIVFIIFLYIVAGILDLTYHERHKKRTIENDCPEKIESEEDRRR